MDAELMACPACGYREAVSDDGPRPCCPDCGCADLEPLTDADVAALAGDLATELALDEAQEEDAWS